ncbi:MAG TPA: metallopeptidase [Planctomycetota bacterium]|nr:metallopeptidase [Planctomycetota bacterium]
MRIRTLFLALISGCAAAPKGPRPDYATLDVEGWTVHVRRSLLEGGRGETGRRALALLGRQLFDVGRAVPPGAVEQLRKVPIWLGVGDGTGAGAEYHPSAEWLREHGHDPAKAKAVEIGDADRFLRYSKDQPAVLLHELAHAYHDRVLGFDHPEVLAAYRKAVEGGRYEEVLHVRGRRERHYAMKDAKEYFAEGTEAWFGTNDFYPFVRAELREVDPELCAVLQKLWSR